MREHTRLSLRLTQLVSLALLLFGLAAACGCNGARIQSMKDLADGLRWYRDGDDAKARSSLKAAVDADPSNDQAHYYLGIVLFHRLKDPAAAEVHLRRASELVPANPEYAYQLASVLLVRGTGESEAESLLRKAIEARPKFAEAKYRLGTILERREQFDETIALYTEAIELKPRFVRPYVDLANLYQQYGFADQAMHVLENAAVNCPNDAEAHNEYGRLLASHQQTAPAIEHYNRALQLRPDYEGALYNLGMAYAGTQDRSNAVRYLRRYLARAKRAEDPSRVDTAEMTVALLEQEDMAKQEAAVKPDGVPKPDVKATEKH